MNPHQQTSLCRFLCTALQAADVEVLTMRILSGGAIQENWLLELQVQGGRFDGAFSAVLRCDSASAGVPGSHGRAEEYALLQTVFDAGVTVPEPLCLCLDASVIGRPFFLMRRIAGTAAAHVLVKDMGYAPDRAALVRRLGSELARIHQIRPPMTALSFLPGHPVPTPAVSPAMRRIHEYRHFLDAHHTAYPTLEFSLRWLELNQPADSTLGLCHGDFRTGNYMVDETGLTGILDWEFASWSDPLEDIGWFCAKCWRFGQNKLQAGGMGAREDFYAGYEAQANVPINREQVHYWEVMAHVKWAIVAIQQAERHCSGQESSLLLALTGHIVPELEWELLNMTESF